MPEEIDKSKLAAAIEYAIRTNAMEGLVTSEETAAMLERVAAGEITFANMRQAIEFKAHALGRGVKVSLAEAWEVLSK